MSEVSLREGLRLIAQLVAADLQNGGTVLTGGSEVAVQKPARRGRKPTAVSAVALHRVHPPGLAEAAASAAPVQRPSALASTSAAGPASATPFSAKPGLSQRVAGHRADPAMDSAPSSSSPPMASPSRSANDLPAHPSIRGAARAA